MKIYLLWFNQWEANDIIGIFDTLQEAERWRTYFLENHVDEDNDYSILGDMSHFAENGDLEDRLKIQEYVVGQLNSINVDNLKLLESEAIKNEKANP